MKSSKVKQKPQKPEISEFNCRVCLEKCHKQDQNSTNFANPYKLCTGFEIRDSDVPKKICRTCIMSIRKVMSFRNKSVQTENVLFDLMVRSSVPSDGEEDEEDMNFGDWDDDMRDDVVEPNLTEYVVEIVEAPPECPEPVLSIKAEPIIDIPVEITPKAVEVVQTKTPKKAVKTPVVAKPKAVRKPRKKPVKEEVVDEEYEPSPDPPKPKSRVVPKECFCDICMNDGKAKAMFPSKRHLAQHMTRVHSSKKTVKTCPGCGRQFTHENSFNCHYFRHHVDPKDYKYECSVCNKRFFQIYMLKSHEKTHSSDKGHPCFLCSAKFSTAQHVRAHLANVHNPKVMTCEYCSKTFTTEKYMKQHLKTHSQGDYKCPMCPKVSFSLTTTLRKHMAKSHPEFPLPSPGTVLKNYDWSTAISVAVSDQMDEEVEELDSDYAEFEALESLKEEPF